MNYQRPCSPKLELDGVIYFPRLCDKARLHAAGRLHAEYLANVGCGMDLWTCEFLGVAYEDLKVQILSGMSDESALAWAREKGISRTGTESAWWTAFMRTRGFRDDLAEKLEVRKAESGFENRGNIVTFMDYIDADDLRIERLPS